MAFGFDPTLSAYLRSMGVDEQNIYADARQQALLSDNSFQRDRLNLAEQGRQAVENVQNDAETRGVYASGATAVNVNTERVNTARAIEGARGASADQQAGYMLDAARRVAELRRQAAEQEILARTRQSEVGAQAVYGGG